MIGYFERRYNMNINSETMLSVSEANRNFSQVTKLVDQFGSAVILKNNAPRYVVLDFAAVDMSKSTDDAEVLQTARALMDEEAAVYEALAK